MPDEQARTERAAADATDKADMRAELKRHEERLLVINHSIEKTYAKLEIMMEKFEVITTMIQALGHRGDISDQRFKSAQETMEITARVLREKTQQDRDNANSSRDPWRFLFVVTGGIVGLVICGIAVYGVMKGG